MPKYTQADQPLEIQTPLGKDALLLVGFRGREAISELFLFDLEMIAPKDAPVAFDKVLGQLVSVRLTLADKSTRFFHGFVRRFSQGRRDQSFIHYRAEVVPLFWQWTKRVQTRTFQHLSVPDILKQVLQGLDVRFQLNGTYYPRDYCVQYNESDFAFASRLMEEEGICYFFQHAEGKHTLVLSDGSAPYPQIAGSTTVIYDEVQGGTRPELRVSGWTKSQEVRSGKYTLWDHCFELPENNLEAQQPILDQVMAGKVNHNLKVGGNGKLEVYEYPGRYAQRFDGVEKGGGDNAADLKKIFEDNKRTARLRMEQETTPGLLEDGAGNDGHFVTGHRFTLQGHFDADGEYLLTRVQHTAHIGDAYRTGEIAAVAYENRFSCIPVGLPYRPARVTPKPTIQGPQTAVVVGPPGEVIFCDKYGRVKVQFYWDRLGKKNADSSCWIRVGQFAAGKGFGAVNLPRIGEEVIVAFLEGDPDQPIIVGNVYNAENMPPYKLPEQRTFSGIVHRSHRGVTENANEIRFENALGQERMLLHSETDMHQSVENNHHVRVGRLHTEVVGAKVPWDKGRLEKGKSAATTRSGVGGGDALAPVHGLQLEDSLKGPVNTETTGLPSRMGLASVVLNSGAGGAPTTTPDPKDDDFAFTDTPTPSAPGNVKDPHAKIRLVMKGADDTLDDQGKTTFVFGGNLTEVHGSSYTVIWGPGDPMTQSPFHDYATSNSTDLQNNTVDAIWQGFPYPLELGADNNKKTLKAKANTTEIHGGSQTQIWAVGRNDSPNGPDATSASQTDYYGNVTSNIHGGSSHTQIWAPGKTNSPTPMQGHPGGPTASQSDYYGGVVSNIHGRSTTTVDDLQVTNAKGGRFAMVMPTDFSNFLGMKVANVEGLKIDILLGALIKLAVAGAIDVFLGARLKGTLSGELTFSVGPHVSLSPIHIVANSVSLGQPATPPVSAVNTAVLAAMAAFLILGAGEAQPISHETTGA